MELSQLYTTYADWVYRKCLRYTYIEQDAEDLVHDVFLDVERGMKKFNNKSSIFTWLYRITVNHCYLYLRKCYRERDHRQKLFKDPCDEKENTSNALAYAIDLQRVFSTIDRKTQLILFLTSVEGLTQEEAASVTGISRRALHKRLTKERSRRGGYFERRS